MRAARVALVATALTLALTGCTGDDDEPSSVDTTSTGTPDPTQASESTGSPATSLTGSGGTSERPRAVEATTDLFDWQPLDAAGGDTVTRLGESTITVDQEGSQVTIDGPDHSISMDAPDGFRYGDVLSDGTHVVVVAQHRQEQKPGQATVIELDSGDT